MKLPLILASLALVFIPFSIDAEPNSNTVNTKYVNIQISTEKNPSTKNCLLTIEVTAIDHPIGVNLLDSVPEITISAKDSRGTEIPYTAYGKAYGKIKSLRREVSSVFRIEISPGKSKKWTIPLEKYFLLPPEKVMVEGTLPPPFSTVRSR